MRAVLVDPRERRLVVADVPAPRPSAEQLLVRVRAAGVNRADLAVTAGTYHGSSAARPFVAGGELAGEVVDVGTGVVGWQVGDRVMAMGRGFAELTVVEAALAMRVPDSLGWSAGGALPVALATMHDALVTNGRFQAGQRVLVNAASSGVGVVGVRMALHAGASVVVGTSRSAEKRRRLTELIPDERFSAVAPDDLVSVGEQLTGGNGIDVIVDNVGASALSANLSVAAIGGRIVQVGRLGGRSGEIDLDELARKRITLAGVTFRTRSPAERAEVAQRAWLAMADAIASGAVVPTVHAEYPLDDVPAAHEALARDDHVGKLVIVPSDRP